MKCPNCQFQNPEGAKFCIECGDPMEFHCPRCGVITPSTGKFCLECGHKLDEAVEFEKEAAEPKGERKHVTVLFSDISGYTAMEP
ncbi:MAG: zinc ribbon domain-containing protein [Deltaproteobacteria bacterium]|nr:zinc ribbon domain-containing protein [Deltaproteobacteria bacterium]MBW1815761.1 zinc ribbon domain-containing protein [Deltaproteobacteria bacterium]